ncbi:MAG: hypothetical protein HY915_13660 [Desulfovibrio sp.]|nr:hypothetical protein [Desulfovibrio sp.]
MKRKPYALSLLIGCGFLLMSPNASPEQVDEATIQAIRLQLEKKEQEIRELRERLERLEESAKATQAAREAYPQVRLHGQVFSQYTYELEDQPTNDLNAFDFTRTWLSTEITFSEAWKAQLTLDTRRDDTTGDREFEGYLHYAWIEYRGFPDQARWIAGLLNLPWHEFAPTAWKYRFQGLFFPNREGYFATPADYGVGFQQRLPQELGWYHLVFVNGEGFRQPESSKHKSFQAHVSLAPFRQSPWPGLRGLSIGQTAEVGFYESGEERIRYWPVIWYDTSHLSLGAEYLLAFDPPQRLSSAQPSLTRLGTTNKEQRGQGFSIFGDVRVDFIRLKNLFLIGRFDWLDPSDDLSRDDHWRSIVGLGWQPFKGVRVLLDWERVVFGAGSGQTAGSPRADTSTLGVHTEWRF